MTDDFDRKLAEMMETAEPAPPLRPGWQARALAALARVRPGPAPARRWVANVATAALVALALGFVPYSTAGSRPMVGGAPQVAAALAAEASNERPAPPAAEASPDEQSDVDKQLTPYRRRAVEFVQSHYPKDPDMLLAAGMLTDDSKAGLALLKKAVDISGSPAAWSAYVWRLRESGPQYDRLGSGGGDPGDPEQIVEARRRMAEGKLPEKLPPERTAPILAAVRAWEAREPDNALPVAVEMYYLYGLHEDAQALDCWQRAGALPKVDAHLRDLLRVAGLLLTRMGMPSFEAISAAYSADRGTYGYFALLRQCARIAQWEGRVAQIEGRPRDAIAWWNSTIALGQHMMESSDSMIGFLVGSAVEGIGAAPTWKWRSDRQTGISGGPLLGGRIFYGPQHAFYVSQVGEAADAHVRDQLVLSKVRSVRMRKVTERWLELSPQLRFLRPLAGALVAVLLLVALLLVFAAIGTWRRRQADEAASLPLAWKLTIIILGLAWVAPAALLFDPFAPVTLGMRPVHFLAACVGTGFSLAILLPLVAALLSRRPSARLRTAWRGNLRRALPVLIAFSAVLSLSLGITAKVMQVAYTRAWLRERPNEMALVVQQLGPAWTHPRIPADSWRAQYPPQPHQ